MAEFSSSAVSKELVFEFLRLIAWLAMRGLLLQIALSACLSVSVYVVWLWAEPKQGNTIEIGLCRFGCARLVLAADVDNFKSHFSVCIYFSAWRNALSRVQTESGSATLRKTTHGAAVWTQPPKPQTRLACVILFHHGIELARNRSKWRTLLKSIYA